MDWAIAGASQRKFGATGEDEWKPMTLAQKASQALDTTVI